MADKGKMESETNVFLGTKEVDGIVYADFSAFGKKDKAWCRSRLNAFEKHEWACEQTDAAIKAIEAREKEIHLQTKEVVVIKPAKITTQRQRTQVCQKQTRSTA